MNKSFLFFLVVFLVLLGYIFNVDKSLRKHYYKITDTIKLNYQNTIFNIHNYYNLFFDQKNTIVNLQKQIDTNKNYKILYTLTQDELTALKKDINSTLLDYDTIYTNVLSYIDLNDFSKVVLNKTVKENKIYPLLTSEGYAAGIAMNVNARNIGLLNNNPKCNYSVFIGKHNNAPGVTSGIDSNGNIIIKHIPIWFKINKQDEVITSGMDRIFPTGIKVGTVVDVKTLINTKEAYVKPYSNVLTKKSFFMIEKK